MREKRAAMDSHRHCAMQRKNGAELPAQCNAAMRIMQVVHGRDAIFERAGDPVAGSHAKGDRPPVLLALIVAPSMIARCDPPAAAVCRLGGLVVGPEWGGRNCYGL